MTQTVIGVFDSPDIAYEVEEALIDQEGLDETCFFIASPLGEEDEDEAERRGQSMDQIRDFLSELFGPDNSGEVEYYADRISNGGALLTVDLPDDVEVESVRETMLNAGATDLSEPGSDQDEETG